MKYTAFDQPENGERGEPDKRKVGLYELRGMRQRAQTIAHRQEELARQSMQ